MSKIDSRAFRHSLGKFATGVTVVTCTNKEGEPRGITANSFSSVSLEPPLVLWNIAKVSNSLKSFLSADYFAINVLGASQKALSAHFARSDHTLFDNIPFALSEHGSPLLPDVLASFECRTNQVHECGDHHIIIGEVIRYSAAEGDPLLFFSARYRELQ